MVAENVLQPLLNNISAVKLATETVMGIMKIDDIVSSSNTDMSFIHFFNIVYRL
jgi:chaperonin GroEL (HSP60 family)